MKQAPPKRITARELLRVIIFILKENYRRKKRVDPFEIWQITQQIPILQQMLLLRGNRQTSHDQDLKC